MAVTKKWWTYLELKTKVRTDLDLQEETFIKDDEMLGYANEAVDEAEKEVMTIYEDYFLDKYTIPIVVGSDSYSMPPNIYANKIRRIIFTAQSQVYKVRRIGDWKKFELYHIDRITDANGGYDYFLLNTTPGDPQILLSPVPNEAGNLNVWYTRQANRFVDPSDVLDIEEGHNFVMAYMRYKCIFKEVHGANTAGLMAAKSELDQKRSLMIGSLTARTPDAENEIEMDTSSYEEMS